MDIGIAVGDWLAEQSNQAIIAILTAVILFIVKPIRDWLFRAVAKAAKWSWSFLQSVPRHMKLRGHIRAEKPLWSYRSARGADLHNSPPTITLMNFKGGVGKTTLAANLAAAFATHLNMRVLLIDLDYQGSLTDILAPPSEDKADRNLVSEWIKRDTPPGDLNGLTTEIIAPKGSAAADKVRLVTADYELTETEDNQLLRWLLHEGTKGDVRNRICRWLTNVPLNARGQFDLIIMDAPPRLSLAATNALRASSHVLIPTKLQPLSALPVSKMLTYLGRLRDRIGARFSVAGVVCTMTTQETPQGSELTYYNQIADTLKGISEATTSSLHGPTHEKPKIYSQFVPDRVDIGRPDKAIGYFLTGQRGEAVRTVFNSLAEEIAEDIGLQAPLAAAAE